MATYALVVPEWRPPSYNRCRGRHWSAEARLKRQTADMLGAYALRDGVPRAEGRRRVAVEVRLGRRQRAYDADNMDKCLCDALVRCGLLTDDSARGLLGRVEVRFARAAAGTTPGTTITLEDVP